MAATKLLANTLRKMMSEPVEGFCVELEDESNLFQWKIYLEGPSDTPYEGGVFQLSMSFPPDFPMSPPELKFISDFWHPNVYKETGGVCISILHPPGEDEMSGELPEERWLPTQTVTTIILSVMSLLSSPNFSSPANVDASVEWRKSPDVFKQRIQRLIQKANKEKPAHIVIPHPETNEEERRKHLQKMKELNKAMEMDDFLQDDSNQINEDEESEEEDEKDQQQQADEEDERESDSDREAASSSKKGKEKVKPEKEAKKKDDKKKEEKGSGSSSSRGKAETPKEKDKKKSKHKGPKDDQDSNDVSDNAGIRKRKKRGKKCIIM